MKKSSKGEVVLSAGQVQATRLNKLEYRRLQRHVNYLHDDLESHLALIHRQEQGLRYHYSKVVRVVKPNPAYQLWKQAHAKEIAQDEAEELIGRISAYVSHVLELLTLKPGKKSSRTTSPSVSVASLANRSAVLMPSMAKKNQYWICHFSLTETQTKIQFQISTTISASTNIERNANANANAITIAPPSSSARWIREGKIARRVKLQSLGQFSSPENIAIIQSTVKLPTSNQSVDEHARWCTDEF